MILPDWKLNQLMQNGLITPENAVVVNECGIDMVLGDGFIFIVPETYFCEEVRSPYGIRA